MPQQLPTQSTFDGIDRCASLLHTLFIGKCNLPNGDVREIPSRRIDFGFT